MWCGSSCAARHFSGSVLQDAGTLWPAFERAWLSAVPLACLQKQIPGCYRLARRIHESRKEMAARIPVPIAEITNAKTRKPIVFVANDLLGTKNVVPVKYRTTRPASPARREM